MKNVKNLMEKIEESGWFYFGDGLLGSCNYDVGYYYGYDKDEINKIVSEDDLKNIILNKEEWEEGDWDDENKSYEEFFDRYFGDGGMEIVKDDIEGGLGYGKIVIDNINRNIKIIIVGMLVKDDNIKKIFGFDNNGKLFRVIDNIELNNLLKSGWEIN